MTATDTIRAMLDERGVEYRQIEWVDSDTVKWHGSDGCEYGARNMLSFDGLTGRLVLYSLTPEQAIEATLGRGECEVEESWHGESEMVEYRCTACDEYMVVEVVKPDGAQPPNYCPNCGRKVMA